LFGLTVPVSVADVEVTDVAGPVDADGAAAIAVDGAATAAIATATIRPTRRIAVIRPPLFGAATRTVSSTTETPGTRPGWLGERGYFTSSSVIALIPLNPNWQ
jgi:hypothetical protein